MMDSSSLCFQWKVTNLENKLKKAERGLESEDDNENFIFIERPNNLLALGGNNKATKIYANLCSKVFALQGYDFGAKARIGIDVSQMLHISIQFQNINKTRCPKLMPMITYIIKDLENVKMDEIVRHRDFRFHEKFEFKGWHYQSYFTTENINYFENSFEIKILIEKPEITKDLASNTGVLTWKVDNYNKKLQLGYHNNCERSHYFCTGTNGYRLMAKINIGENLADIAFLFLKGESDNSLAKDFDYAAIVTLINQHKSTKNFVISVKEHEPNDKYHHVSFDTKLLKKGFLVDDSIILNIEIKIKDAKVNSEIAINEEIFKNEHLQVKSSCQLL